MAEAALCDKVIDTALALLIAAVPVLDCGVLDLRISACRQLHHCRMQLQARIPQKSIDISEGTLTRTPDRAEACGAAGAQRLIRPDRSTFSHLPNIISLHRCVLDE